MAEKWDFTMEDTRARVGTKRLKQSSPVDIRAAGEHISSVSCHNYSGQHRTVLLVDSYVASVMNLVLAPFLVHAFRYLLCLMNGYKKQFKRDAKATSALRQKERAEGIAKKWGLPWPESSRKGQWGRMRRECLMKQELYATIQCIVDGKEQEPANPPQLLLGSSQGESHNSVGFKQGECHEESNDYGEGNGGEGNGGEGNGGEGNGGEGNGGEGNGGEGNGGEGNGGEGNGGEGNGGEGNGGEGNGGEGNGREGNGGEGEGNDGTSNHQKERGSNKLSKLHRPAWMKELFFSLQASLKLSIKDTCGWVMENTLSKWKTTDLFHCLHMEKQLEKKENHQIPDATGKKRGPKPSRPCGEIQQSKTNNTRVPYSLLCLLAGMVVAQYNAGFPLSTTLLMPMVLGIFKVHKISWVPSQ